MKSNVSTQNMCQTRNSKLYLQLASYSTGGNQTKVLLHGNANGTAFASSMFCKIGMRT